jgi:enterochelin esterase-like enzyme
MLAGNRTRIAGSIRSEVLVSTPADRRDLTDLEVSDPRFERDGIRQLTVGSAALGGRGDISLYVPTGTGPGEQLPVVLLLHGSYGSHWAWFGKGGAHRTARRLASAGTIRPMVLACPSDGLWRSSSGYVDQPGGAFEAWIVQDAVGAVRRLLDLRPETSPLFIAGLSMGGYGALRLGAKHAAMFAGISAHSSVTRVGQMTESVREATPLDAIAAADLDVLGWMERRREDLPPLRFDCGLDDHLLAGNRRLHEALVAAGIAHVYAEYPGGHTWGYWEAHLDETLLFFESVLRGAAAAAE